MIRIFMFLCVVSLLSLQVIDRAYIRGMTAIKKPIAVSAKEGRVFALFLETQEIVNAESMRFFAEDALVKIFNFRPGQDLAHVSSEEIRFLFINDKFYENFKSQFLAWSEYEFRVNNISIKEAIVSNGELLKTPPASSAGARIWRYRGVVPIMDRGVGGSSLSRLNVDLSLVYLGPEGGMGIFSVKLSS
jgi:hypothetical protein